MTRLAWDAAGERRYEHGVDRGVLYTHSGKVAAWNGLRSIDEKPAGAEVSTFYLDGERYNQVTANEEFTATLSAFTYPDEFEECDGLDDLGRGLYLTAQSRSMFDLSYRTKLGNDTDGPDHGYRIHLVYNALATPTNRTNTSGGESISPVDLSWDLTTLPIVIPGKKSSSHYYIDSTTTNRYILAQIEDILYGSASSTARMPTAAELTAFFKDTKTFTVTDNGDGTWTADGPDDVIKYISWYEFVINYESAKIIDSDTYTLETV